MEAFLVSTGVVALAEIGDKTQLLALLLAARWRRPVPIIVGILAATIINHALAGAVGAWVQALLSPTALAWVLGLGFLAMAVWILIPDRLDDTALKPGRLGVFGATFVAFFLAEMGDKTQIATVAMVAQFSNYSAVVIGTTLGMMIANVPVVLMGGKLADRLPVAWVHRVAAVIFAGLGLFAIANAMRL